MRIPITLNLFQRGNEFFVRLPLLFQFFNDFNQKLVEVQPQIALIDNKLEEECLLSNSVEQQPEDIFKRYTHVLPLLALEL